MLVFVYFGCVAMRSLITFGFAGGFVTLVHIAVGLFLHNVLGISAFNANLMAFCVGFFLSYYMHRTYTFRSKAKVSRSMPRFFVIAAISLVLNQLSVYGVVNIAGQPYYLALATMIVVVGIFTYVMGRIWAFSDGEF